MGKMKKWLAGLTVVGATSVGALLGYQKMTSSAAAPMPSTNSTMHDRLQTMVNEKKAEMQGQQHVGERLKLIVCLHGQIGLNADGTVSRAPLNQDEKAALDVLNAGHSGQEFKSKTHFGPGMVLDKIDATWGDEMMHWQKPSMDVSHP